MRVAQAVRCLEPHRHGPAFARHQRQRCLARAGPLCAARARPAQLDQRRHRQRRAGRSARVFGMLDGQTKAQAPGRGPGHGRHDSGQAQIPAFKRGIERLRLKAQRARAAARGHGTGRSQRIQQPGQGPGPGTDTLADDPCRAAQREAREQQHRISMRMPQRGLRDLPGRARHQSDKRSLTTVPGPQRPGAGGQGAERGAHGADASHGHPAAPSPQPPCPCAQQWLFHAVPMSHFSETYFPEILQRKP